MKFSFEGNAHLLGRLARSYLVGMDMGYVNVIDVNEDVTDAGRKLRGKSCIGGFMNEHAGPICMVTHIARVWINRVRLPILHVVSWTGKLYISLSAFAPENLVSRDGLGSPSRVSLLISILRLNLMLTYGIPPEFRGGVHSCI